MSSSASSNSAWGRCSKAQSDSGSLVGVGGRAERAGRAGLTTNEKGALARREQLIAEPDLRCSPSGRFLLAAAGRGTGTTSASLQCRRLRSVVSGGGRARRSWRRVAQHRRRGVGKMRGSILLGAELLSLIGCSSPPGLGVSLGNESGEAIYQVRLQAGGSMFGIDQLPAGEKASGSLDVVTDSAAEVVSAITSVGGDPLRRGCLCCCRCSSDIGRCRGQGWMRVQDPVDGGKASGCERAAKIC